MTAPPNIMRSLSKLAYAIACCGFGAMGLILYLYPSNCGNRLESIDSTLRVVFCLAIFVGSLLSPSKDGAANDISPRAAGITVVLTVGLTATAMTIGGNLLYGTVIGLGTLAIAAIVWRFATKHEKDIGEHRFTPDSSAD